MNEEQPPQPLRKPWTLELDLRDVVGIVGVVTVAGGLGSFHWGLAVAALGVGLIAVAWKLAR